MLSNPLGFEEAGRKSVSRTAGIKEVAVLVITYDERVEILVTGRVSPDDKFLALIDAHLLPLAGTERFCNAGIAQAEVVVAARPKMHLTRYLDRLSFVPSILVF